MEATDTWTLADAKAKLSSVIEACTRRGPQVITRRGRPTAVLVDAEEWARKVGRKGTLAQFLAESPLRDSGLEISRIQDGPRDSGL